MTTALRGLALAALLALLPACGGSGAPPPVDSSDPLVVQGAELFKDRGCGVCHSTTGSRGAGPTVRGLAGSTVSLANGGRAVADDDYLFRALVDPDAQITKGYPEKTMAAVSAEITPDEARAIVAYIKTLR